MIARSVVLRKRQIDLWLVPLRDPLAPNPQTGKVVAPHGLIGQSFDGDATAVDGKKDHCTPRHPLHPPHTPPRQSQALLRRLSPTLVPASRAR